MFANSCHGSHSKMNRPNFPRFGNYLREVYVTTVKKYAAGDNLSSYSQACGYFSK